MKKFLSLIVVLCVSLAMPAQSYRYDQVPGSSNVYTIPHKEIKNISYASTKGIAPFMEETTYDFAQLTGAMTLTVSTTECYTADKMTLIFHADGTNRVVTFSTGFTSNGTLTVSASSYASVVFVYNGSAWYEQTRSTMTSSVSSLAVDAITEKTSGGGITLSKAVIENRTATTYTATGTYTVTAAQLAGGLLVAATSTATSTMVLPTTALLATQLSATAGTTFDFLVSNAGGTNGTVTVAVSTGMTASGFPGTNTLTLAGSATVGIARFRVTFISASASTLTRIN